MEVRNLSYRYADQTLALDQVNLKLHRHERLALMGSNGSGKSTLFLNLNGVYRPTGGQILYQDKPLDYSRKGLLDLRRRDKPVHFLSGGQKKRVSIADILVMEPELMILDEPFSALDPKHARMIDQILEELSAAGITVVVATHDTGRAYRWAERVVILNQGKILADGTPNDIFLNREILEAANLEQPEMLQTAQLLKERGLLAPEDFPHTPEELRGMLERKKQAPR